MELFAAGNYAAGLQKKTTVEWDDVMKGRLLKRSTRAVATGT